MIVQKFGGTSVGSVENIKNVSEIIINSDGEKFVVISAMSGITNSLYSVIDNLKKNDIENVFDILFSIKNKFSYTISQLIENKNYIKVCKTFVEQQFENVSELITNNNLSNIENHIVALGEICTSYILSGYLNSLGQENLFLYAPEFLVKNINNEPELELSEILLRKTISNNSKHKIIITQGFICSDIRGELSNLGRGGSDYSATIIGSILNVEEIQIWSDQKGILNNDPRYVENTYPLEHVSYTEAEELAYFGAKILHPQSIFPAKIKGIKISVKNSFNPSDYGTYIDSIEQTNNVKAVAAKDNITIIRIKSAKMMNAFGFLKRIFQVFEDFKTPVDVITTSEVSVSMTIDNDFQLEQITDKLREIGEVEIEKNQSIICFVGDFSTTKNGIAANIFNSIKEIPIKMISQGASNHNVTIVIDTIYRSKTLNLINNNIFNLQELCIQQ